METKDYIISAILISIVIIGGFGFAINFYNSQNGEVSIMDDPVIKDLNLSINQNLSQAFNTANDQKTSVESENPTVGSDTFLFSSMINTPKKLLGIITDLYNIIFTLIIKKLGISMVIISGFATIIVVIIIFSIWRTIKQG